MKKAKILAVLVTLAMTMCACGNESSKVENEVEQEVNISSENIIPLTNIPTSFYLLVVWDLLKQ